RRVFARQLSGGVSDQSSSIGDADRFSCARRNLDCVPAAVWFEKPWVRDGDSVPSGGHTERMAAPWKPCLAVVNLDPRLRERIEVGERRVACHNLDASFIHGGKATRPWSSSQFLPAASNR